MNGSLCTMQFQSYVTVNRTNQDFFIFVNIESTQEDTRRVTKWGVSEDVNDIKKFVSSIFKLKNAI